MFQYHHHRFIAILSAAILTLTLTGCQPTPETEAVTSKNDGAFEASIANTAKPSEGAAAAAESAETAVYTDSFQSADESVSFTVSLEVPTVETTLPVIQVTPHTVTPEEAQTIAQALFGDAEINEYSTEMSKTELEEQILELKQHISSRDALVEYYGGDESLADQVAADYESRIAALEKLYQTASDTVESEPCRWTFYPTSHYDNPAWGIEADEGYDDTEEIRATTFVNGFLYDYFVTNREASDYRIHNVYAYISDTATPTDVKYSTQEPTAEDIESAQTEAERILSEMNMGDWTIDSCEVADSIDVDTKETLYKINIVATPVYNGVKVTHHAQISSLNSDDSYASDYYYEEVTFCFSGGHLASMWYYSPLEVVDVLNENVEIKPFDEIMEVVKNQLQLLDAEYFWGVDGMDITINRVELGLSRIRIKNNESDFYLTPTYTFYGLVPISDYDGKGNAIAAEEETELCVINAVDGSVIDVSKGY